MRLQVPWLQGVPGGASPARALAGLATSSSTAAHQGWNTRMVRATAAQVFTPLYRTVHQEDASSVGSKSPAARAGGCWLGVERQLREASQVQLQLQLQLLQNAGLRLRMPASPAGRR